MGAVGGALAGFATTGDPIGACIGRGFIILGRSAASSTTSGGRS